MFFNRGNSGGVNWILVGLGNPGKQYESTRHNMGWLALDSLMEKENFKLTKLRFKAWTGILERNGNKILVMKPQTYMNLSGQSVREIMNFYKIPEENLIVIYDDFDLPIGSIRVRKSGGPGTHNGMKSVVQELGSRKFPRVRVGIGSSDGSTIQFVIGKVGKDEQQTLNEAAEAAASAAADIIRIGIENAMNIHNTRKSEKKDDH